MIWPREGGTSFNTPWWRFKEWYRTNWHGDDGGDEDRTIADDSSTAIHSNLNEWNTLRIERRGTTMKLYINTVLVRTIPDVHTDPYHVGLMARHTGSGATELSFDVVYEWDRVGVTPR